MNFAASVTSAFMLLCLSVAPMQAAAVETRVQVRVLAADAKLIGDAVGGARVAIRNADGGELLADGITTGETGDTQLIMHQRRTRGATVFDTPGAAGALLSVDLQGPTQVEISAEGPLNYPQAMARASKTLLLTPGADVLGEGIVLELHGLIVEVLDAEGDRKDMIPVRARVRMLCSCPTEPGGLWSVASVTARLLADQQPVAETQLSFSGQTSVYSGELQAVQAGRYTLEIIAADAATANYGASRTQIEWPPEPARD